MSRPAPSALAGFAFRTPIQTRWSDNDMFGHVNNVEYYRFFEIVVVDFLRGPCAVPILTAPFQTLAVESQCRFHRPLSWPGAITGALGIDHVGNSSVRYRLGLFDADSPDALAAAEGHWVHVFVDRASGRPTPIPAALATLFEQHR